ncbi:MAG: hypothetical protein J6X33_04310 [Clostridiales bacterium]|nr:hypothetical protein [Clostridiales bacterium]
MALDLRGVNDSERIIHELTNKITKFEIILQAYYELMEDKGISQEVLYDKIDEIIGRQVKGQYGGRRKTCPKCGKVIQESYSVPMRGTCMMCGTTVMFYPFEKDTDVVEENREVDPLDDLGF